MFPLVDKVPKRVFQTSAEVARIALQWGFVPLVVYLGLSRGIEQPNGVTIPLHLGHLLFQMPG